MEQFGERLAWAMGKRNMTKEELCKKTGIGSVSLDRFITGYISPPPMSAVEKIADALDVIPEYLTGETDGKMLEEPKQSFLVYEYRGEGYNNCRGNVSAEINLTSDSGSAYESSFVYVAVDNSMKKDKIGKGDKILINPEKNVTSGSLAALKIDGGRTVIRRVFFEGDKVRIVGDREEMCIDINSGRLEVVGAAMFSVNYLE